jgi:hypothetical protein
MLGIVISVVAGAIIAFLIAKWQMRKNKIVHFTINSYDIGKGLHDVFPEFELRYSGDSLSNEVRVLKGGFINVGYNDIDALNGKSDIKMILPKKCIVKAIKIPSLANGLKVNVTVDNDNKNEVLWGIDGIFISDEYFEYTAIVEVPGNIGDLDATLSFQHRIKNTKEIQNTYVGQVHKNKEGRKLYRRASIIVWSFLFVAMLLSHMFPELKFKVFEKETNKAVAVGISPKSKIYVDWRTSLPVVFGEEITAKDLEEDYTICPITTYKWYNTQLIVVICTIVLILVTWLLSYVHYYGKNSHIIKVLSKSKNI